MKKNRKIVLSISSFILFLCALFLAYKFLLPSSYSRITVGTPKWNGEIGYEFGGGNGTKENPYVISNGETFSFFLKALNDNPELYSDKNYILSSDIDLNNKEISIASFNGVLDGNGHTIGNIYLTNSIFNKLDNASIVNLNLENISINTNDNKPSVLAREINNTTISRVTIIKANVEVDNSNSKSGILASNITNSNINRIYINGNIETNSDYGMISSDESNNTLDHIILNGKINNEQTNKFFNNSSSENKNSYVLNEENIESIINELNEDEKEIIWQNYNGHLVYETKDLEAIKIKKAAIPKRVRGAAIVEHNSGVEGTNVYVNDLIADYNYYQGQNYVYSPSITATPTMENKNIYDETNLVKTEVVYDGVTGGKTGTISLTENQNKIYYYKYYEVNDNGTSGDNSDDYILIELLDSPFTNRPTNLAFHGWKTDYSGAFVYLDTEVYVRYAKIPVTYDGDNPEDISITFNAIWEEATTYTLNGRSWTQANNNIKAKGMEALEIRQIVNGNLTLPSGYFTYAGYATFYTRFTGYDVNGTYRSNYRCTSILGCAYYNSAQGTTYNPSTTYYKLNGQAVEVTEATLLADGVLKYIPKDQYTDMTGYFIQKTAANGTSLQGYYNSSGTALTGTCSSSGGCSNYYMIQADDNGEPDINVTYYYMVTRDTNILVMNGTMDNSWTDSMTKPFTLTSVHNGTDYRNSNNASWDIDYAYGYGVYTYVKAFNDLNLENLSISSGENLSNDGISTDTNTTDFFYGNYNNIKIGRGLTGTTGDGTSFIGFLGGNNSFDDVGSSSSPKRYRMIIESGVYRIGGATNGVKSTAHTHYIEETTILGSDIDRVKNTNNKLIIGNVYSPNWSGTTHSKDDITPAYTTIYKSGSFGTKKYDHATGAYIGGRGYGTIYGPVVATVEGGSFYNIVGGPVQPSTDEQKNKVFLNIKGGSIDNVTIGAGTNESYGNRILSITGGEVNYSVFGGSNAYDQTSGTYGILRGNSYIYVGGNATIGSSTNVNNNNTLWGAEAGSLFGNGVGNSASSSIGSNNNAYIVIADEAHIRRNVYGGGNYGAVGIDTSQNSSEVKIKIIGGTVDGSVYGGGNQNGGGSDTIPSNTYIEMQAGLVKGSVYGGSNIKGIVYGDSNIDIKGGTINGSVYGGGQGGYDNDNAPGTYVAGSVLINIGDTNSSTSPQINTSVYGGSAYGAVCTPIHDPTKTNETLTLNINKGTVVNSVFGGGQGSSTYTPIVACDIEVNINGGSLGNIYGANDASGIPSGALEVNLNGGTGSNVYGGGNNAGANITNVNLNGGTFSDIYGGSNQSGAVNTTHVTVNSNTATAVYGGNNAGGTVTNTNVVINAGSIPNVFGGGNAAEVTNSSVIINGGTTTNVYGAGNRAGASETHVTVNSGTITNLYGGSNQSGSVSESNVTVGALNAANNLINITNLYGGNNAGGVTSETNVAVHSGTIVNIFGGGNEAVTHYNNVDVDGGNITNALYGGGNNSATLMDVALNVSNVTLNNLYGGGNLGDVEGDVVVNVQNTTVNASIYGGGNQADVLGDVTLNIGGTTSTTGSVFGGGNHGMIGASGGSSTVTVNIKGASVTGNVYGGCNTSVVNGNTVVNIGASANTSLPTGNILINGTVFGGGEANASGSENYDFSFISVTRGIDINIDGTNYNSFALNGSIFGSGNASSSQGTSNIYIKNVGTRTNPNVNISIQRADKVTMDNSVIELLGATDRTNEYSNIKYSFNRIGELVIKNNSVLLLQKNANLLKKFTSAVDVNGTQKLAEVTIDDNGNYTRNVDNRLYNLANNNLNVMNSEDLSDYGIVKGMTYFGMYTKYSNGSYQYGMYKDDVGNGDSIDTGDVIIGSSYVLGSHMTSHDITKDGYYTNYANDDYTSVQTKYIDPTPEDADYYMWLIGAGATNYDIELTASKYSSLGTKELSMLDFSKGNTIFHVSGFNSEGLSPNIQLVDSSEVPNITKDKNLANSKIGLAMKSETSEWTSYNTTSFTSEDNGSLYGDTEYQMDNQNQAPSLMFYLYHAKNISLDEDLGTVVVSLQAMEPKNEIEYEVKLITITITITAVSYTDGNAYDASITYGRKYEMPSTTSVNITNKSQFTTYFGLYGEAESFEAMYGTGGTYKHVLTSTMAFPEGTKITMIDIGVNDKNPEEYYYIVSNSDYTQASSEVQTSGETSIPLSKFIKMNSPDTNNTYSDAKSNQVYYDDENNYAYEEFLFIIDLENANMTTTELNKSISMELRNNENRTIVSVLGIRQEQMIYNLYNEQSNIALGETVTMPSEYIYNGLNTEVNYETAVNYSENEGRQTIIDTNYETSSMGLNISFYDSSNTLISSSLLEDTTIEINGTTYHSDSHGVFRIKLAGKVSNLSKKINMHIGNTLPKGTYKIEYKLFASEDGLYSDGSRDTIVTKNVTLLGAENAIKVETEKEDQIKEKEDTSRKASYIITYESELQEPNIRVSISKRNTNDKDTTNYTEIDPNELFTTTFVNPAVNSLTPGSTHEKMVTTSPTASINVSYNIKDNVDTGTYKVTFRLYNKNNLIDEVDKYLIIKTEP